MIALVVRLGRAVLGATLNRWRGGWIFSAPRFVRLTAMGTAVGTVVYLDHQHLIAAVICGIWAAIAFTWGWGGQMDMGRNSEGWRQDTPEVYTPILDAIFGPQREGMTFAERWRRDAVGLAIRGMMITAPVGVILLLFGFDGWFGLRGIAMPIAYELAYRIPSKVNGLRQGPELGEAVFGLILLA